MKSAAVCGHHLPDAVLFECRLYSTDVLCVYFYSNLATLFTVHGGSVQYYLLHLHILPN